MLDVVPLPNPGGFLVKRRAVAFAWGNVASIHCSSWALDSSGAEGWLSATLWQPDSEMRWEKCPDVYLCRGHALYYGARHQGALQLLSV